MVAGIILVIAGLLIAVYPPLLAFIFAAFLILLGVIVIASAYHYRKMYRNMERRYDNPLIEFILRF